MPSIPEALATAFHHHQGGRLQTAEQIYRQILQADPNQSDALHLLGVLAHQVGKHEAAVQYIERAIGLNGQVADFHNNLGAVFMEQGKLDEAAASFRRALALKHDFAGAHANLGAVFKKQGRLGEAIACWRRTVELKPDLARVHNDLGDALREHGNLDDAIGSFLRAVELQPNLAEAHNNLGLAFQDQGKLDEAVACFRRAAELKPQLAEAHNNLGVAFMDTGRLDEAVACFGRALELKPGLAGAHDNLASALKDQGKLDQAITCFRRALEVEPGFALAHNHLGAAYEARGELEQAMACFRRAAELQPDFPEAHYNLGGVFSVQGKLDEAVACYRRALTLKPNLADAHNNLGNAFKDQGRLDEALLCFRRALELRPGFAAAHSNLICSQLFSPECDAEMLREEHRRWNERHAEPLAKLTPPHRPDRSPERRLRIGYVSPDFREHCQAFFTTPLFSAHQHRDFEIVCYADVARPDRITERLRSTADLWRNITGLTDEQVAQLIQQDRIDILVDLTMHMTHNRLLVFARRPAPVQVCWLAYPGTTGLPVIDYRLTDPYLDPPGLHDSCYTEESIRLPDTFWCYDPMAREPAVSALPAVANGFVTFGSLNNFCKVNPLSLRLWAGVLKAVDRSRLVILAPEGSPRRKTLDLLAEEGVAGDRVTFLVHQPRPQYLTYYHGVDIGLDPIPYHGHTTSLDSAWMGVPVVTLAGSTVVGRAGVSQLMNLGLPELIATGAEQSIQIAAGLAHDLPRLSQLRGALRARMQASPLMDAPRFARNVEAAYRKMWQRWCAK